MNHTGSLIRKYRCKKGLSQLRLSKAFGLGTSQFISLIERGESKLPIDMAKQMTKELNIPRERMQGALVSDYRERLAEVL